MFVNRIKEKKELEDVLSSDRFEFMILYGRRRVGKTTLVLEAIKKRSHIYYLAVEKNNIQHFISSAKSKYPQILNLKEDWEIILDYLKDKAEIIIIDEFQNMIKEDKKVLSIFQRLIDTNLKKSRLKLVLMGSSVSMISSEVLGYKSPLYGRKTISKKIRPMGFFDIAGFFPKVNLLELAQIYGFADGIPYYLEQIETPFWEWLDKELKEPRFIKDELNFIMRYEFEDLGTYKTILEAIANGKNTVGEIKDFANLSRTDISPYLSKLINTEFIERQVPLSEKTTSKKGRYFILDQFVAFWFRFIYQNRSAVEEGIYSAKNVRDHFNVYMGYVFEKICRQFLIKLIETEKMDYNQIGRWWHDEHEIDIVALSDDKKAVLFCECKWSENVDPVPLIKTLKEKSIHLRWNNKNRIEKFAVFAKSFKSKKGIGPDVLLFDLRDFEKFL